MDPSYIKRHVTMQDVLHRYGYLQSDQSRGRIPCPLHNGHDKNFSYKDHSFRCYVCGESGTVIDFTMRLFGLPFSDACKRLDDDFRLGAENYSPDGNERSEAVKMRQAMRVAEEAERIRFVESARCELERIDACRRETLWYKPFILAGEIFWPDGYRNALAALERAGAERDERAAMEYYEACQRKAKRKEAV